MSSDPNKKSPRTFQARDVLWETFEQMSRELECSVDYLINEAMKQYARQRGHGANRTPYPSGRLPESAVPAPSQPAAPPGAASPARSQVARPIPGPPPDMPARAVPSPSGRPAMPAPPARGGLPPPPVGGRPSAQ